MGSHESQRMTGRTAGHGGGVGGHALVRAAGITPNTAARGAVKDKVMQKLITVWSTLHP